MDDVDDDFDRREQPAFDEEDGVPAEGQPAAEEATKPKRITKPRAPRPKLTLELLEGPKGLDDVMEKFPKTFRGVFRGKGHEISDLQHLLELYSRWHQRLFPHCSFDDFILKLEKLSASNLLKDKLRTRRTELLRLVCPEQTAGSGGDRIGDAVRSWGDDEDNSAHDGGQEGFGGGDSDADSPRLTKHGGMEAQHNEPDDEYEQLLRGGSDHESDRDQEREAAFDVLDEMEMERDAARGSTPGAQPVQAVAIAAKSSRGLTRTATDVVDTDADWDGLDDDLGEMRDVRGNRAGLAGPAAAAAAAAAERALEESLEDVDGISEEPSHRGKVQAAQRAGAGKAGRRSAIAAWDEDSD